MAKISFDFYGLLVLVTSSSYQEEELSFINDFSIFRNNNEKNKNFNLKICLLKSNQFSKYGIRLWKTRLSEFRQIDFKTRQYIYTKNSRIMASSFDRTRVRNRFFVLKSTEVQAVNEILYYYILSAVGEYFDSIGLMRVHACTMNKAHDGSSLVWGLPGAGKSTLSTLISLFANPNQLKVVSDEISLVDLNKKAVCAFPMRFSLKQDAAFQIKSLLDSSSDKKISLSSKGFFFDKKYTVDRLGQTSTFFEEAQLNKFYILRKSDVFAVKNINYISRLKLYYQIILGIGLIQMYEYFIRLDNAPILIQIFYNRLKLCIFIHNLPIKIVNRGSNFACDTKKSLLFFLQDKSN